MAKLMNEEAVGAVTIRVEEGGELLITGYRAIKLLKAIAGMTGVDLTIAEAHGYVDTVQMISREQLDLFRAGGGVNLLTGEAIRA